VPHGAFGTHKRNAAVQPFDGDDAVFWLGFEHRRGDHQVDSRPASTPNNEERRERVLEVCEAVQSMTSSTGPSDLDDGFDWTAWKSLRKDREKSLDDTSY